MRLQIYLSLLLMFLKCTSYARTPQNKIANINISEAEAASNSILSDADNLYHQLKFSEAITLYQKLEDNNDNNTPHVLKKMALSHAALNNVDESIEYIEEYLFTDFNTSLFDYEEFISISDTTEFKTIIKKYKPSVSFWSFLYFYVALIGFFVSIVLNLNKKMDFGARLLISSFVFIHSFFILNIFIKITNYQYVFPHSYLMSTCFSFLYGPLLYFYFKRITQEYKFRAKDLLHLVPTLLFLIYIVPIYLLSADEKLELMLTRVSEGYNPSDSKYVAIIVALKLASLMVYGYYIRKLYLQSAKTKDLSKESRSWQKNLYGIHFLYILIYAIYGVLISNNISSGLFYHSQITIMAVMVIYVGYSANIQPNVFSGLYSNGNKFIFKYEKSGLTESLSHELKTNLIYLFDIEKIYRENRLSLDILSNKLNTTRHNASQVINEHFNMSFHELINKYRIQEAKEIMSNDFNKNFNIIDIAYEVGYNNKVTFNKAFKKETSLTPSEYQRSIYQPQL